MADSQELREAEDQPGGETQPRTCCNNRNEYERQTAANSSIESTVVVNDNTGSSLGHTDTKQVISDKDCCFSSEYNTGNRQSVPGTTGKIVTGDEISGELNTKIQQADKSETQDTISTTAGCQCDDMKVKRKTPAECPCDNTGAKRNLVNDPTAGIRVEGRPMRCVACSAGHRASTCKHIEKPLFYANRAGRPTAISKTQRKPGVRSKCNCPKKTCLCEEPCQCKPECYCTFLGYIVAYLYGKGENKNQPPRFEDMKGQFTIARNAWTNSAGQEITEEEALRNDAIKAQLMDRESKKKQNTLMTPTTPASSVPNMSPAAFMPLNQVPVTPDFNVQNGAAALFPDPNHITQIGSYAMPPLAQNGSPGTFSIQDQIPQQQPYFTGSMNPTYDPRMVTLTAPAYGVDESLDPNGNFPVWESQNNSFSVQIPAQLDLHNPYPNAGQYPYFDSTSGLSENQPLSSTNCCQHDANLAQNQAQLTQGCTCGDLCVCRFCPQHPWNAHTQAAVNDYASLCRETPMPTGFQAGPVYSSCIDATQLFNLGKHDNLEDAVLEAAQRADPSVRAMMVFQPNGNHQYLAPAQFARNGEIWGEFERHADWDPVHLQSPGDVADGFSPGSGLDSIFLTTGMEDEAL